LISGSGDGTLRIWCPSTGECLLKIDCADLFDKVNDKKISLAIRTVKSHGHCVAVAFEESPEVLFLEIGDIFEEGPSCASSTVFSVGSSPIWDVTWLPVNREALVITKSETEPLQLLRYVGDSVEAVVKIGAIAKAVAALNSHEDFVNSLKSAKDDMPVLKKAAGFDNVGEYKRLKQERLQQQLGAKRRKFNDDNADEADEEFQNS